MINIDNVYGKYTLDAPGTIIGVKDLNYVLKNNNMNYTENIKQNWGVDTKIPNIEPNNKNALYNPNATDHQDFELHLSEESKLVVKILQFAGVSMKDYNLVQIAGQKEASTTQQEKQ